MLGQGHQTKAHLANHTYLLSILSGRMTKAQRSSALHRFKVDQAITVFLISLKTGNCGLNLTHVCPLCQLTHPICGCLRKQYKVLMLFYLYVNKGIQNLSDGPLVYASLTSSSPVLLLLIFFFCRESFCRTTSH